MRDLPQNWLSEENPLQRTSPLETSSENLEERSHLFNLLSPQVLALCQQLGLTDTHQILSTLWHLWLPLGIYLVKERQKQELPLIFGILGGQGTGKTTLTKILCLILKTMGYTSLGLSLDDLYKTYSDRQKLLQQDPRLIWRGPPGTHDVLLGIEVLEQLRNRQNPVDVPRFDKSLQGGQGDRINPEQVAPVEIVIFEGWFVGVRPIPKENFQHPPAPINTPQALSFALDSNERLQEYLPLWELLDRLMVFYPKDYRWSLLWRLEAEQKMIAQGKTGMSPSEIEKFVTYFWQALHPKLFIEPLIRNCSLVDIVVEQRRDRRSGK